MKEEHITVGNTKLGDLIRLVREKRGLPRTKVAEFADIPANSMVRYELAGTEGGKYPSLQKLIRICKVLELDPRNAFDAICNDPNSGVSLAPYDEFRFTERFRSNEDWLTWKHSVKSIEDLNSLVDSLVGELSYLHRDIKDLKAVMMKSGPDQKGQSRSRIRKSNVEAVGAASTKRRKKGDG
jgi:transcriptional regulator with XRE-family HTH domain